MIKEIIASAHITDLFNKVAEIAKLAFDEPSVSIYESGSYKSLHVSIYEDGNLETHKFDITGMMTEKEREAKIKEIEDFRDSILNEHRYVTWAECDESDGTKMLYPMKLSSAYEDASEFLTSISEEFDSPIKSSRGTELSGFPSVWSNYVQVGKERYYTTYENPDDIFG